MGPIWLMRMYEWARNPPSPQKVKMVLAVIAICLALWGIELLGWWPDALQVNPPAKPPKTP